MPNGQLAHVILFGTFAAFALLGGRLIDRRKRRESGDAWQRLRVGVVCAPRPPRLPRRVAVARLLSGVGLYAALIWLHPLLFGVSPLP